MAVTWPLHRLLAERRVRRPRAEPLALRVLLLALPVQGPRRVGGAALVGALPAARARGRGALRGVGAGAPLGAVRQAAGLLYRVRHLQQAHRPLRLGGRARPEAGRAADPRRAHARGRRLLHESRAPRPPRLPLRLLRRFRRGRLPARRRPRGGGRAAQPAPRQDRARRLHPGHHDALAVPRLCQEQARGVIGRRPETREGTETRARGWCCELRDPLLSAVCGAWPFAKLR
mmetsp:Transcript_37784/g.64774  ORF Transcript_37784/g.64774 Transcript_37784/m.64774 type:complete len:231 (-) Transcript_37784:210-902(-)